MGRYYAPPNHNCTGEIDHSIERARLADRASRRDAWLALTDDERAVRLAAMRTLAVTDRGAALRAYRTATGAEVAEACQAIPLPEPQS